MNILREKQKLLPMGNFMGGLMGGGGGGGPSSSTSYQTNIPEYARPYVDTMLGATQKQLFQTQDVTNPETGQTSTEITGFQPYRAFGGTYDEQGNQTAYDPSKAVAGFTGLQTGAQQAAGNLQVPGQYGAASGVTGQGIMAAGDVGMQARGLQGMGMRAAGAGNQYARMATDPYAMGAYMSPYMQNVVDVQQAEARRAAGIAGQQQQAEAVGRGAFGGSRDALMRAERERNLNTQLGSIQAQGLQNAFQNAQQAQQFGSTLGLQGLQAGAGMYGQGIGAQQAAINQQLAGAGQLAGIGGQELAAQQGIIGLQNQMGAQQQAYNQQVINQAIQDYANAQQYPLMQLGTMSNMLRGLPMQAQTTNQYVATANPVTQGIGAMGTYGALKGAGVFGASGGLPSEFKVKSMASGGIASYDVGGEVESQLASMDEEDLKRQAESSSSPTVRRMAQRLLREKQMEKSQGVGPVGPMGVDYQAAPVRAARGGILAFRNGGTEDDGIQIADAVEARDPRVVSDVEPLPREGIMMAAADTTKAKPTPTAPAPTAKPAAPTDILSEARAVAKRAQEEADKPESYFLGRVKEGLPENTAVREYQSTLMAERANAEDENRRQRAMRAAQFFAKWGTTPGNTLMAGLSAIDKSLPDMIADEQQYKKAKRELDKVIFDVDNSIRLEEMGHKKDARAMKEKAAERAMKWNDDLIRADVQLKGYEMQGQTQRDVARINAAGHGESARASRDLQAESRAQAAMNQARRELGDVRADYEKIKNNDEYKNAAKAIKAYETAKNKGTEISPRIKSDYDRAQKTLYDGEKGLETRWGNALKEAEKAVKDAEDRWKSLGPEKGKKPEGKKPEGNKSEVTTTNW